MFKTALVFIFFITHLYASDLKLSFYDWEGLSRYQSSPSTYFKSLPSTDRIFLSLNAQELKQIKYSHYEASKLSDFIQEAKQRKVKVELLIGDPNYIFKQHFHELEDILALCSKFDFTRVQLDIEPSGLKKELQNLWPKKIVELIIHIHNKSYLPLSLSINHQDLTPSLLNQLEQAGLAEVIVMYYTINQKNIIDKMTKTMSMHPRLNFSLALSVEPIGIVERNETFAQFSQEKRLKVWSEIDSTLKKQYNYNGIVIQSLKYFNKISK